MSKGLFLVAFFGLSLLWAVSVPAGTLDCASADAKLHYSLEQADGGANIGSSEQLNLNNEILISKDRLGGNALRLATLEPVGKESIVDQKVSENYRTTFYTQKMRVVRTSANNEEIFRDFVLCKRVVYIGMPRP